MVLKMVEGQSLTGFRTMALLGILTGVLVAGCDPQPGSNADLSRLAATASTPANPPGAVAVVDGPGGTKLLLINSVFVLSPDRDEARLAFYTDVNPDCSDLDGDDVRITVQPLHGTVTVVHGPGFASFPQNSVYARCTTMQHVGKRVIYRRGPGFAGADEVTYEVYYPTGQSLIVHYKIISG